MKKVFAALLCLLSLMTVCASAADTPAFVLSSVSGKPGETVTVTISTKNNPGISSFRGKVSYDESVVELLDVSCNQNFGGQSVKPQKMETPVTLIWMNPTATADTTLNTTFFTLQFKILDSAKAGTASPVTLTYDPEDVYNVKEENVSFAVENGRVSVSADTTAINLFLNGAEYTMTGDVQGSCKIISAVYTMDGKMLGVALGEKKASQNAVSLSFSNISNLPDQFRLRSYFLDANSKPLTTAAELVVDTTATPQ